ncbi:MAG: M4 family metallopeptidase [Ferruginibacter sp.]
MCNYHDQFNPIHCILPPYMSDKLSDSSNKKSAQIALKNSVENVKLRAKREFVGGLSARQALLLQPAAGAKKKVAKLNMQVLDLKHGTNPSTAHLVWDNGKAVKPLDKTAKNVVAAGSATWDTYYTIFGRNSVDNLGLLLKHYIHYSNKYDNAMWDGSEMVYGDGDGTVFGDFTSDPDIIGHELTHGVTQYESNLEYHVQSGALNESLSDVFGIMVKQRMLNQDVKQSNWLIGENVLIGSQYALRSMKAPGTAYVNHPDLGNDPQPATMDKFVKLPDTSRGDWGGVHYNSGITNFAFYVTAFNMGGFAWEKAGKIWYNAMTDNALKPDAKFADFKKLTIAHAGKLFGAGSKEEKAVKDGWKAAKV